MDGTSYWFVLSFERWCHFISDPQGLVSQPLPAFVTSLQIDCWPVQPRVFSINWVPVHLLLSGPYISPQSLHCINSLVALNSACLELSILSSCIHMPPSTDVFHWMLTGCTTITPFFSVAIIITITMLLFMEDSLYLRPFSQNSTSIFSMNPHERTRIWALLPSPLFKWEN